MNTELKVRAGSLGKGIASSKAGMRWDVIGGMGFGKSTMLHALVPVLKGKGLKPILLDPPRRNFDTAASTLSSMVDELADASMLSIEPKKFMLPDKTWDEKFATIQKAVADNREEVVLLCDEPMHWFINARDDARCEAFSNRHARQLAKWLQGTDVSCRTVIANSRNLFPDHPGQHQLPNSGLVWRDLSLLALHDTLEELENRIGNGFSSKPYVAMQLLGFYAAVTSVEDALLLNARCNDVVLLAKEIVNLLGRDDKYEDLVRVIARISLVRGTLDSEVLAGLGIGELERLQKSFLMEGCFRRIDENTFRFHRELEQAVPVSAILSRDEITQSHEQIAKHYGKVSKAISNEQQSAYRVDVEHFFHQAVSGNANWDSSTFYFVDQLHAWGRYLSHEAMQHEEAATVFERAVDLDESDDYAHHYLAYNLDCIATDEDRALRHYAKAIKQNPTHPWWWSRWINFLITTGRMAEAREQLVQARLELGLDTGDAPRHTFQAFHKWVIRLLLHRAQLDLAEQLFADVDEDVVTNDVGFLAMQTMLSNLKFTRDGWDVLPVNVDPDRDWNGYPFIDKPGRSRNQILHTWNPAKVVAIGEESVDLLVGKQLPGREHRFGSIEIPTTTFLDAVENGDLNAIKEGTFVELSFYGDENRLRVDVFKRHDEWIKTLPGFDPPNPARYLQARRVEA